MGGIHVDTFVGMVVRSDGPQVTVRDPEGRAWRCVMRGRLRKELTGSTNPVVVGDRVEVRRVGDGEGVVEKLIPRRSRLARRAVAGDDVRAGRTQPREQVLAANLDLTVVVIAAPPRPTVIDRFLAIAGNGAGDTLLCVNKIDLVDRQAVEDAVASYRLAVIPLVLTSALTGEGVDELRQALAGKLVAFIGPSGAGKSSLLNALDPALKLRVGALAASGRGSHTTSWASTVQIGETLVIDTPGLREVGFVGDEGRDAAVDLFPEITALAGGCRFRDCSHTHEPRCAVKVAVEAGDIPADDYRRYARLARSGRLP